MVKIIFFADSHLGFDSPLRPKKEKRRRGIDFLMNFDAILHYAKINKADLVIHGGDLFFRTRIPAPIIDLVYERIFNFAQTGIPFAIVPGNHESSELPISLMMQHSNIHYYTKSQVFRFRHNNIDFDIAGFPCVRYNVKSVFPGIINEIQTQLREDSVKFLCMHQAIEGSQVGPSNYTFRKGNDVIGIEDLPDNFDLILSGHIHRAQVLYTRNSTPILYPGSIERTSFAEKDEEKGFYEIDITSQRECSFRFIVLNTRPMIDYLFDKEAYTTSSLKNEIILLVKEIHPDSIIRFKMKNTSNLTLLNTRFLNDIIPPTMNYQISGF
ncbi:MAG: metallophosphoesterase [Bacteroidales bacterium]